MHDHPALQILIGTAGLDKSFCDRLLNGDRSRVVRALNLSKAEEEAVLSIEAGSLTAFAQALLRWMEHQDVTDP